MKLSLVLRYTALYALLFSIGAGPALAEITLTDQTPLSDNGIQPGLTATKSGKDGASGFELSSPISDIYSPIEANQFDTVSSQDLLNSGLEDARAQHFESACQKFQEVLRRDPGNAAASNNLAACRKGKDNSEAALSQWRSAIDAEPTKVSSYNQLSLALVSLGRYDEALATLYRALRLSPADAEINRSIGHVLALKHDYEAAVTAYQEALKAGPCALVHFDLGECLRGLHRYEQALIEYRATEKAPQSELGKLSRRDIDLRIAKCYEGMGRYEAARKILSQLLESAPTDTDCLNCLGVVLWKMAKLPEAVYVLESALKIDPGYPQARNNLGIALYELKRYSEAVDVWKQAIALKPDYPEAHYNMGVALYQSNLIDQSVDAYKECLKYAPDDANAHNNLGLALLKRGERNEAILQLRKAIECDANLAQAYTNLGKILKEGVTIEPVDKQD